MKHLIIIGVGGFAREVHWHAQNSLGYGDEWNIKGFLDGDVRLEAREYKKLPLPLCGDVGEYKIQKDDVFVCAIGDCAARERLTDIMEKKGATFINLIHRTALIAPTAKLGHGCILAPFCIVQPEVVAGNHTVMNICSGLGHDAKVGNYCSFMAGGGLMGYASVGNRVYMADGAKALPHAVIEDDAYVGVDSVVFKRVRNGQKVFGNPAMQIG